MNRTILFIIFSGLYCPIFTMQDNYFDQQNFNEIDELLVMMLCNINKDFSESAYLIQHHTPKNLISWVKSSVQNSYNKHSDKYQSQIVSKESNSCPICERIFISNGKPNIWNLIRHAKNVHSILLVKQ